jgi:hypothetical protein
VPTFFNEKLPVYKVLCWETTGVLALGVEEAFARDF